MFRNPGSWQYFAIPFSASASDGVWRIRIAVKNNNLCFRGLLWRMKPRSNPFLVAVIFKALTPRIWPIGKLAFFSHVPRQVFLFVAYTVHDFDVVASEVLKNVRMAVHRKSVDRRITRHVFLDPILDDWELCIVLKKTVDVVNNNNIQINKKGLTFQIVQG